LQPYSSRRQAFLRNGSACNYHHELWPLTDGRFSCSYDESVGLRGFSYWWLLSNVLLPVELTVSDIAVMLICVALTLMVSWLVYRTVERPMIMFGRTIVLRREVRSGS
jgi:hypothetical protein